MKNKLLILALIVFVPVLISGCLLPGMEPKPEIEEGIEVEVEIKEGMTLRQISDLLQEKGIIDSSFVFRLYVQQEGKETELIPGEYTLVTGSEMEEVLEAITREPGPVVVTYTVAVPEGFTVNQIEARIAQLPFIDSQEAEQAMDISNYDYPFFEEAESLEGFLFPKTYEVTAEYSAEDIVTIMLEQFKLETSGLDYSFAYEKDLTHYDILKIASLVEREAYVPEERELISAVIHNRLDLGMTLGIDATIRYGLEKWNEELTLSDLADENEYNTRVHGGLTPTPICNPGIESIEAALNPADVEYLYFVVTDQEKGTHSFSKTLEEHERNIQEAN